MLLYAAWPGLSASGGRAYSVASSLLLWPSADPPVLSVAWTLVHELMFYAFFLLFFLSRTFLLLGLIAWLVAIAAANQFFSVGRWLRYPLNYLNVEFMLGMAAAYAVKKNRP